MKKVFVALGGNIGDRLAVLKKALEEIERLPGIFDLKSSNFYQTSPVSSIPQEDYFNAVCVFTTSLTLQNLYGSLQDIEMKLGKKPKSKEAPRIIDLDLLFFGTEFYCDEKLQIPHPRWMERKFVLIPLSDLVEEMRIPDIESAQGNRLVNIRKMIELLSNKHNETIRKVIEV